MKDEFFAEVKDAYSYILFNGASITALCNLTEKYMKNPVGLTLETVTLLARSQSYTDDLVQEYINIGSSAPPDDDLDQVYQRIQRHINTGIPTNTPTLYTPHLHTFCGCKYNGKVTAVIDMPHVTHAPTKDDLAVLKYAASVFALAMHINSYVVKDYYHPMQNYLRSLLNDDPDIMIYQNPHRTASLIRNISRFGILYIHEKGPDRTDRVHEILLENSKRRDQVWFTPYRSDYVVVYNAEDGLLPEILQEALDGCCYIGICDPADSLNRLHDSVKIAEFAISIGIYLHPESDFIDIGKYKFLYPIAGDCRRHPELYTTPAFLQLQEYDRKHGDLYLQTLRSYFRSNGDPARIAAELFLHKNTVVYRLSRIREMFGIDLSDISVAASVFIALLIHDSLL